ncbi:two-component system, sensor histidine kinase RegB [Marinobacter antarcticus]|uniref:histidine kinase n=1 Tax=Marinobacter antarcticus TaxID=564117 RepID=A0A1M6PCR6_9GAMM|nr:ATP-binding protein [Marinobacter antarcticus]SHK05745.1 two-component system, sensor histidine kinase RegB [Marinobacter antarcticus]
MTPKPHQKAGGDIAGGRKNMQLLIQLRWIAVLGQITTIAVVSLVFEYQLPLLPMLLVIAGLILFNLFSLWRDRLHQSVTNRPLFLALLVDVVSLTALLFLSGGATNPFAFLFLLQVILSAVLLEVWATWIIVGLTSISLAAMTVYYVPLAPLTSHAHPFPSAYLEGLLISFALNAILLAFVITRITRNLRSGDAQLADLRQRAAEEEHIVRMGLLASGAAHELGTPLATMSVILGDWRRMPELTGQVELQDEIAEMQAQLQRCKTIVSGILLSAGETRGESSVKTTLRTFLQDLVEEWRNIRSIETFQYDNRIIEDCPVVFDTALKQMIWNVLDNALEASPQWVSLEIGRNDELLQLEVSDRGPGFPPEMLAEFGKPYQSSKGKPGGGLGLFLSVNVARRLGGTVEAHNRAKGGARVKLTLPLAAIAIEDPPATWRPPG